MAAQIYRHPGLDRITEEDIRRRDALEAFLHAEMARKRLVRIARISTGVACVAVLTAVIVLVAWVVS